MFGKLALLAALSLGFAQTAAADDWEDCTKSPSFLVVAKACTAVLNNADTLPDKRVIAYIKRSKASHLPYQTPKAIEDATSAIELNPALPEAYAARCEAYALNAIFQFHKEDERRNLELALPDCNRAIELNPRARPATLRDQYTTQRVGISNAPQRIANGRRFGPARQHLLC